MNRQVIRTESDREIAAQMVMQASLGEVVEVGPDIPQTKTQEQDNLKWLWCGEMHKFAGHYGYGWSKDDWNGSYKYSHLLPIWEREGKHLKEVEQCRWLMAQVHPSYQKRVTPRIGNSITSRPASTKETAEAMTSFEIDCNQYLAVNQIQMQQVNKQTGEVMVVQARLSRPDRWIRSIEVKK